MKPKFNQNYLPHQQVCEGDRIIVNVKNHLPGESCTIHWHGIHQVIDLIRKTVLKIHFIFISICRSEPLIWTVFLWLPSAPYHLLLHFDTISLLKIRAHISTTLTPV
jgi:hypothetical protein